jgi:predicted amidophosphoribosyltransferase
MSLDCKGCDQAWDAGDTHCSECGENLCQHEELDHGVCCDCGEDRTDDLAAKAEYLFEGDR